MINTSLTRSQGLDAAVARWSRSGRWPTEAAAAAPNIVRPAWPSCGVRLRNTRPRCSTAYSTWPTCSITRPQPPHSSCLSVSGSSYRRSRPHCTRWPPTGNRNRKCRTRNRCRWPRPVLPPPQPQRNRPLRYRRNIHRRRPTTESNATGRPSPRPKLLEWSSHFPANASSPTTLEGQPYAYSSPYCYYYSITIYYKIVSCQYMKLFNIRTHL